MGKRSLSVLYCVPALVIYSFVTILPLLGAFFLGFTSWKGSVLRPPNWVGLNNYVRMFSDNNFMSSVRFTLLVSLIIVVVVNTLGFGLALLLNRQSGVSKFARTIFFTPSVISTVAVSFIWLSMLSYTGVINSFLQLIGLESLVTNFLGTGDSAFISVCIVEIWRSLGFFSVIYLAALQGVPAELYDACVVDGGGRWHKLRHVTLPLISHGFTVSLLLSLIGILKFYDVVKVITNGGPGFSTQTITYYILEQGIGHSFYGYSSAQAMFLFVIIAVITVLSLQISRKAEVEI